VGATFIHWTQPHAWAEVTRYGLEVTTRPPIEATVALAGDQRLDGDLDSLWSLIGPGMDAFSADARALFPAPYRRTDSDLLSSADRHSIADRIAQLEVSDDARAIIDGFWAINCNRPASEGALTHALRFIAACGDWRVFNEACARFKLVEGLGALVQAIYEQGQPDVVLGDPATLVTQSESGVAVRTAAGREIRARACVLALPLNVVRHLEVEPPLSPAKREAFREGAPAGGFKLWALTAGRLERSYLCMAGGDSPLVFARTEASFDDATVLGLYGPERERLDLTSPQAVERELGRWLPEARVAEVWSHDWCGDPWSGETWRVARREQLTRYADELRRRENRVVLAGADVAPGVWNGFVDGALESALGVADELAGAFASGQL
jgi:hypothetical protein